MKVKELEDLKIEQIEELIVEKKNQLSELMFKHAANNLKNTAELGLVKREIAKMNTIKNAKKVTNND